MDRKTTGNDSKPKYDLRDCKGCETPFRPKRNNQHYCKPSCRYQLHNKKRGRVTGSNAIDWIEQHLITVSQASSISGIPSSTIRSRAIRNKSKNKLKHQILAGRILVYKSDFTSSQVERSI